MKDKCPKCKGEKRIMVGRKKKRKSCPSGKPIIELCSLCHGEGKVDPAELFEVECECETGKVNISAHLAPTLVRHEKCKGTGWRPMTADEVEEMQKTCWTKTLDHTVTLMVRDGYTLDYHGKPVRLREGK